MYEYASGVQTYYLETGYGPFNTLGTNWYDSTGKKLSNEQAKAIGLPSASFMEDAKDQTDRAKGGFTDAERSSQRFFSNVEGILTQFQGLGYYATLFIEDDQLLSWRERVDRMFATLYLGTEYWSSEICGTYLDGEEEGIAYAETPQGFAQVGAHIEASRTEPAITETGNPEYIYKITYAIRNGDYDNDPKAPEKMRYNVILKGQRTASLYRENQELKRGSTVKKSGSSSIVQDSSFYYNQVCIQFDQVPYKWKISDNELCNTIQSAGGATSLSPGTGTSASSSTSSSQGSSEFNDI